MLIEPRSDIIKELTYSRQKTNECSVVSSAYGAKARVLNCTRVQDEMIAPINTSTMTYNGQQLKGYCYGVDLGELSNTSLTDNWFCCQEWTKEPVAKKNNKILII